MSASAKKKLRKEQTAAQMTQKQQNAQKEAKKLKLYTTVFVVAIAAVIVAALVFVGTSYYKNTGIAEKNTVAAVIGDHEINNVELNYYYVDLINNNYSTWKSSYGDNLELYLNLYGLDINRPLNDQTYMMGTEEDQTWADYFLDSAIEKAKSDYLLSQKARAEGFTLSEDGQAEVDATKEQLPLFATVYGYSSVDAYLRAFYGPGAEEETYYAYTEDMMLALEYYNAYGENLQIDDAAVRAYEADKFDQFSSFSYATYRFNYYDYLTGGTTDEEGNTTYTDAENEAARQAMKADAEAFPVCATTAELDTAIANLAVNADASETCTVYTDSLYENTSTVARDWLADSSRKSGDFIVLPYESTVTNENGEDVNVVNDYYAVLFLDRNDNEMPLANVRHILVNFEGGTTDENGNTTYTDEEKATAMAEAQAILDEFLAGDATDESFAALATEKTDDTGSSATGGLYEDITPEEGVYVESFTNWATDASRKAGDTGIIESTYGYHVMYYVGDDALSYRDYMITETIRTESLDSWYSEIMATAEIVEKDTSHVNTGLILANY